MDSSSWLIGALVVIAIVIVASLIAAANARTKAREAYSTALRDLRRSPNDSRLRERALVLGRDYSDRCRNGQGVTTYDELAIKNDIDAITAGSVALATHAVTSTAPAAPDPAARLAKLEALKSQGLVTDDEYTQSRARILAEI